MSHITTLKHYYCKVYSLNLQGKDYIYIYIDYNTPHLIQSTFKLELQIEEAIKAWRAI